METTTAEEYTELRAMSLLERVGLERGDRHAMIIAQSMGGEFEGNPFAFEVETIRTLEEELAANSGSVIHGNSNNP